MNTDESRAENRTKRLRQVSTDKPTSKAAPEEDEDKKTLAQQVADGKYGLIQKELFASPAKRPGIISYEVNPEVPKDNVNNLGGLQPEEIWLAENHLLVLKGGLYGENDQNGKAVWPPIDNYIAPHRQVRIPPNPKVPPPFPVQLKDGGPIEFLKGKNGTGGPILPFFDPRFGPPNFFPLPPFQGPGGNVSHGDQGNSTVGNGFNPPFPFPPPPGIGLFPPAVAFLPPPGNLTELDEDDPSIYYPPPYDFVYQKDNSSFVPAGPLVPGIVLPPPPDFFAPYENKTKSSSVKQIPSRKNKPKSRPPQFIQEAVTRKTTRPTKPPKKTVTISIIPPKVTTTLAPIIITTGDSIQNEIVPQRTLPSDTPVGEWVPIPAPRPFYISEIKNLRGNRMKLPLASNNPWDQVNGSIPINALNDDDVIGYDYTPPQKKGRKYPVTVTPMRGFKPIYVPPTIIPSTTIRPTTIVYTSTFNSIKSPDNLYFYGEPEQSHYPYQKRPFNDYYDYSDKNSNEVNTVAPAELYNDVPVKSPIGSGLGQSHFDLFRQQFESSTTTGTPINFYYFDKNNPLLHTPNISGQGGNHARVNTKQLNSPPKTTTEKPPIFEYSYSAPGYGTIESPKVGANFITTPKPAHFEINFPVDIDQQQYPLQTQYRTTQKPLTVYRKQTTQVPLQYSTNRPRYAEVEGYNSEIYTPKPTSTKPQYGLDDVTSKYFSIFGQKLNDDELRVPTTPNPPVPRKPYYNNYENGRLKQPSRQNVKFPSDDYYDDASEQPYYPQKPIYRQPGDTRYNYPQQVPYPNYYRLSSPQYDPYSNYDDDEFVSPGHPLHSDINVNLKRPPPPLEPEAELIDPAYVRPRGNSFISYQLPGSGGHFYFLTPQTIKAPYPAQQYPSEYSGYYKRNVQSKPRRPRNPRRPLS